MISTDVRWQERDHVLQSLYIAPALQQVLPDLDLSGALSEESAATLAEFDRERLASLLGPYWRVAGTRFFNLSSARGCMERGLRSELPAIQAWLKDERSARYTFDYFGGAGDPLAGYGIWKGSEQKLRFTKTVRFVLQRGPDGGYLLWIAYPLLSPRSACWIDQYQFESHPPATPLDPIFYYFASNYLSVTSDSLYVDAALQGTTDFYLYESQDTFDQLRKTLDQLNPRSLGARNASHLKYELETRCLDETLPEHYVQQPEVLVEALQQSLKQLAAMRQ